MGWTSMHLDKEVKNGKIYLPVKEYLDDMYTWESDERKVSVLKSALRGRHYFAAVEVDEGERKYVSAAVALVSINSGDYFNFGYKPMDEDMGPYIYDCPKGILDLLTPTDNEYANEWRNRCRARLETEKRFAALKNLPTGAKIEFESLYDLVDGTKKGDKVTLTKRISGKREIWWDGVYKWKKSIINPEYVVVG